MNRLAKFRSLKEHAWHKRNFKKLSLYDIGLAEKFILSNERLDHNDFEAAVNRMFLDHPCKPLNWSLIVELLANSNSLTSTSPQA